MAMKKTLRILVQTKDGPRLLLRVKELADGSILYSLPGLDGRRCSRLHSEESAQIPPEGDQRFRWDNGRLVLADADHLTYHAQGAHVISSPGSGSHWGRIVGTALKAGDSWSTVGLLLPAALDRLPEYRAFDSTRDTLVDLPRVGVEWVFLRLGVIGKLLHPTGGNFPVPASWISPEARSLDEQFGGVAWFLLPLETHTLLFSVGTGDSPYPPRTALVRWEPSVGGVVHVAYFE